MNVESLSDWRPPEGGITAANLYDLPGLSLHPHTELIDGGLFFPGPQLPFHTSMVKLLDAGLNTTRPDGLLVRTQMSLRLGLRTRVEPDILVLVADADPGENPAENPEIMLAVEVVAPISEIRDRELKPKIYAATGITHFWRVEEDAGRPTIYVYELDPATATYFLTGTHQEQRLVLTVPYAIEIDLSRLDTGI